MVRRESTEAGWHVTHGECVEAMSRLPAGSVDAVVTDPPYGTGWAKTAKGSGVGVFAGRHEHPEWDVWSTAWIEEAKRVARGIAFILPRSRLEESYRLLPGARIAFYVKSNPRPNGPTVEPVLFWGDIKSPGWDVTAYNGDTEYHPCQKPEAVTSWMLAGVPDGGSVLDPFMGSGQFGLECIERGLRYHGIEREAEYVEIAVARLEAASRQGRLFTHASSGPACPPAKEV